MRVPLQVTLRDIDHSDAVENAIREKAEKLGRFYSNITSCRVSVEMPGKHKHQGKSFSVHLDLRAPGCEIVINRDRNEDLYVALRDTFDAATRQLEEFARRQRGEVKQHAYA